MNEFQKDILEAMDIIAESKSKNSTHIYSGLLVGVVSEGVYSVKINGKVQRVRKEGSATPELNTVVQVFVPQNNMSLAFFMTGSSGGGTENVSSVNGKTGDVILTAGDVGALPVGTVIPTKTSQLTNDSNFITSSQAPVQSVNGATGDVVLGLPSLNDTNISSPADGQILSYSGGKWLNSNQQPFIQEQADWNETSTSSVKYIQNKPTSLPADGGNADTVDGKHAIDFATSEQGKKADTALQSIPIGGNTIGGVKNGGNVTINADGTMTSSGDITSISSISPILGGGTSGDISLSHANSGVTSGIYKSVTVNATGHVTGGTNPTTISQYGITDAKISNGVVTLGATSITPVTSVNNKTGSAVSLSKSDIGLSNVDNIKQYSSTNQPPYPVTSVDGATGEITTNAVKTISQTLTPTQQTQARNNIGAGTSSFSGNYNDLTNKPSIPTKTSQLTNDSNFVSDANYVHTDNNFATVEKNKLSGIEDGAEVNIINSVQKNGTALTITNKTVNITVPTTPVDIGAEPAFAKNTAFNKNFETSASNIKMNGVSSVGTLASIPRADHVHPVDTSRASQSDLTTEITNRINADTNIQTQITNNDTDILSLQQNKADQSALTTEITNRVNADANLQNQIDSLIGANEYIGSIQTVPVGQEQTVLTQFVVNTVGRQPRQGDEVSVIDRSQLWIFSNATNQWSVFLDTSIEDATTTAKGVVKIGNGIHVSGGTISANASSIGLGNVPNVATNNQTPTWTTSGTLSNLVSGELLSVAFGKIAKAVRSLIEHISNISNPHKVTKTQVGLSNVDNVKQYSANNPPPYPVTSVNTQVGVVSLGVNNLNDTTLTSPTNGQILGYNGTKWVNQDPQTSTQQQANWAETSSASVQYIQNKPTSMPPNGSASGDLTGSYPNPTVANGKITKVKLSSDVQTSLEKADTALQSISVGGTNIGGVKNGGNVTISADGTMNATITGGLQIVVSPTQPPNLDTNSFWYQET